MPFNFDPFQFFFLSLRYIRTACVHKSQSKDASVGFFYNAFMLRCALRSSYFFFSNVTSDVYNVISDGLYSMTKIIIVARLKIKEKQ